MDVRSWVDESHRVGGRVGILAVVALALVASLVFMEWAPPVHASGAFPVTIEHKYGTVTIPSEPKRVVTLG